MNLLQRAEERFQAGDLTSARILLESALRTEPENTDIIVSLAAVCFASEDYEQAKENLYRAHQIDSQDASILVQLAAVYLKMGQVEEFESHLRRALQLDPCHREALKLQGDVNFEMGRFVEAAQSYVAMVRRDPNDIQALLPLGACFYQNSEFEAAEAIFARIVELDPHHALAAENLEVVRERKTVDGGRGTEDGGRKTEDGGQRSEVRGQRAEDGGREWVAERLGVAGRLHGAGDLAGTAEVLREVLRVQSEHLEGLISLGAVLFQMEDYFEAKCEFIKARQFAPEDASLLVKLALTHLKLEEVEDFEWALGRALEMDPNNRDGLKLLADLNFQQGNWKDAAQGYVNILRNNSQDLDAMFPLAVCFFKTGDVATAKTVYERVLEISPGNELARQNLDVIANSGGVPGEADTFQNLETAKIEEGVSNVENLTNYIQKAKTNIEHPTSNIQHPTSNVLHPSDLYPFSGGNAELSNAERPIGGGGSGTDIKRLLEQAQFFEEVGNREAALECLEEAANAVPRDANVLLALGSCYYNAGRYENAREQFRRAIEVRPREAEGYTRLAMTALKLGRVEEFESSLGLALEIDPENRDALKFLAKTNLESERVRDAGRVYAKLLEQDPGNTELLLSLGLCFYKGGELETARMVYERVLEADPNNSTARENLAELDRREEKGSEWWAAAEMGDAYEEPELSSSEILELNQYIASAEAALNQQNFFAAKGALEQALQRFPQSPDLVRILGSVYFRLEEFVRARESFERYVRMHPGEAAGWTQLALCHHKMDEVEEFEKALGKALKLEPENVDALRVLAQLNLNHGSVVDAAQTFGKILRQKPEDMECLLALGVCFYKTGDLEAARMMFEKALEIEPGNEIARENLRAVLTSGRKAEEGGRKAEDGGQWTEGGGQGLGMESFLQEAERAVGEGNLRGACERLQEASAREPCNAEVWAGLGSFRFQLQEFERSFEALKRAAELRPDSADIQTRLALAALKADRIDDFELALGRALELDENYSPAVKLLGDLNFQQERWNVAGQCYSRLLQQTPEDLSVLLPLGICFFKGGDLDAAKMTFNRILELDPTHEIALANMEVLNRQSPAVPSGFLEEGEKDMKTGTSGGSNPHPKAGLPSIEKEPKEADCAAELRGSIEAPAVAMLGNLKEAHDLIERKKYLEGYKACLEAIELRSFHPDAYLQMLDIALSVGDEKQALACAERLAQMTPMWPMAQTTIASLLKQKRRKRSKIKWPPLPRISDKPRLSVCLIAKDEEDYIGGCLRSVRGIARQIVVVDTGSSDRTREIAREHGAEVYEFAWNDNFSDARNAALEHARGDWVLILDADEELPEDQHAALFNDMSAANVLGYRIPIRNAHEADQGVTYVPRLFRNAPALFFAGRVHEQIYASVLARKDEWGMEATLGTAVILHHGYDPGLVKRRQKVQRNLNLMARAVQEMPNEPALLMNYGLDLVNDGRLEEGLEKYREAVALLKPHRKELVLPEVRERLLTIFGAHLIKAGNFGELLQVMTSQIALDCGPTASMHFMAGLSLMKLDRPAEAVPHFRLCLEKRHLPGLTPPCREIHKAGPHHLLAECLGQSGELEEAEKQYRMALEIEPQSAGVAHDFALFLHRQGRSLEAIQSLHGAVDRGINEQRIWYLGSFIANSDPEFSEFALDWTEEALKYCPEHEGIRIARGEALLNGGKLAEALEYFERIACPEEPSAVAAVVLCRLVQDREILSMAADLEQRVSREFVAWYRRLLATRMNEAVLDVNNRLERLKGILPTAAEILRKSR